MTLVSFDYDGNGNLTRVTDSLGGVTEYEYDPRDLLAAAQQFGPGVNDKRVELVHDRVANLREVARFASLDGSAPVATTSIDYECDACDLSVSSIDHVVASAGLLQAMAFVRDPVNNIVELTDAEGTHLYTYDALDRLLTVDHPAGGAAPDEFYTYDPFGNRLSSHLSSMYAYAPGSRLTQDDAFDQAYDLEGNMLGTRDRVTGEETVLAYDHRNRLVRAETKDSGGGTVATVDYAYDASNRLIKRTVNGVNTEVFVYDHVNRLVTLGGLGNVTERRFHFPSIDELLATEAGGETRWLLADQAGTVRDVVGDDGLALAHYEYDSFGNLLAGGGALDNDVLFQSRELDDVTGLGYFRARFYDPKVGRYVEEDPQEPFGYDFVSNNPLVFIDPFGETTIVEYKVFDRGTGLFNCAPRRRTSVGHPRQDDLLRTSPDLDLPRRGQRQPLEKADTANLVQDVEVPEILRQEAPMFRRRQAKGVFFEPGPDYWVLFCRDRYDEVLLKLTELLPSGLTLHLEGIAMAPLIASYLEDRPAADPLEVASGTIWPRSRSYHIPMTMENMAGLAELMDHVAEPQVGDHLNAYKETTGYLIWHDAFSKAPLYLRKDVAEEEVQQLCESLGCEYSSFS